jgi:hypothetical protein
MQLMVLICSWHSWLDSQSVLYGVWSWNEANGVNLHLAFLA